LSWFKAASLLNSGECERFEVQWAEAAEAEKTAETMTVGFAVLLSSAIVFNLQHFVLTLRNFDPDSHDSSHHPCSVRWKRAF